MHYRSEVILGLREPVYIRYSLFDLSKINVYSIKGDPTTPQPLLNDAQASQAMLKGNVLAKESNNPFC